MQQLHGVNLGGWLVSEKWMVASVYKGTDKLDEHTLSETEFGHERLQSHHETFIQEEDFAWIAAHHIDLVRIPVGYWVFGDKPPYIGSIDRLDWAFDMADKYGLKILVDLHGAPGSQNGFDHSGHAGKEHWYHHRKHRLSTLEVLQRLAERYRDRVPFWGLELVNEPVSYWRFLTLRHFYKQAYKLLDPMLAPDTKIVFSDGYVPWLMSGVMGKKAMDRVVMDCHFYQCFYPWDKGRTPEQQLHKAEVIRAREVRRYSKAQPIIVGEWSRVLDGKTMDQIPLEEQPAFLDEYEAAQRRGFAGAIAECYWSYKTEDPGIWNYRSEHK